MHSNIHRLASGLLAVLATGTLAAALSAPTEPCAYISTLYAQVDHSLPLNIPGQLAQDCLSSMPFESDKAVKWIDEYTKYIQFQSDIELLASMSFLVWGRYFLFSDRMHRSTSDLPIWSS
jgi:hypothetical protein